MKKNRKMEHLKMFSTFGRRWLWISMNMLIWIIVVLPNVYGQQSEKLISLNVNQVSVLEAISQINLLSDNSISYKREELEKEVSRIEWFSFGGYGSWGSYFNCSSKRRENFNADD